MPRAVRQMTMSSTAAMTITSAATPIHSRHEAQSSASVILRPLRDAVVDVVALHTGPLRAPEALLLARTPARLPRTPVLPLLIEELHRLEPDTLTGDVAPAARHVVRPVPADLAARVPVAETAEAPNDPADAARHRGRDDAAGRRLVERRELVGEPRHRARDADAPRLHATAHVIDRAALDDVAVNDRAPAANLDEALRAAVLVREQALLVVASAVAAPMHRLSVEPRRAAKLVERRQRPEPLQEEQHREHGLREVVALRGAARDVDHRQAECAAVILAEPVHHAHGVGRVSLG